jgi:hypothetical protein
MARNAGDDGRPAGGTIRTSGTKTPRKVQWAVDEENQDISSTPHALDEHGLDVSSRFLLPPFDTILGYSIQYPSVVYYLQPTHNIYPHVLILSAAECI